MQKKHPASEDFLSTFNTIQGVIFDMGRTLLVFNGDQNAVEARGARDAAHWLRTKKRIKIDEDALATAILSARADGMRRAAETLSAFQMREAMLAALRAVDAPKRAESLVEQATRIFFQQEEDGHEPVPGAMETLKTLYGENLKLGLLSNATDDALIQRLINRFGFRPYLSPVFSSAGVGWQKPKADPFLLIAERWGIAPENIAVVGDRLDADILGAQNAGMHSVLVTYAESPANAANRHITPDITIDSIVKLPTALAQL